MLFEYIGDKPMLYKDIDIKQARQCCREHTVFNDKKRFERVCDKCPLRRAFKDTSGNIHQGICWFILMKGLTEDLVHGSPYAQMEQLLLEHELVSYPLEWLEWLKIHPHVENLVSKEEWKAAKKEQQELAERYANEGERK